MYWNLSDPKKLRESEWLISTIPLKFNHLGDAAEEDPGIQKDIGYGEPKLISTIFYSWESSFSLVSHCRPGRW